MTEPNFTLDWQSTIEAIESRLSRANNHKHSTYMAVEQYIHDVELLLRYVKTIHKDNTITE